MILCKIQVWGFALADANLWPGDEPPEIWARLLQVFAEIPGCTASDDGAVWGIAVSQPWIGSRLRPVDARRLVQAQRDLRDFAKAAVPYGATLGHPRLWTVEVDLGPDWEVLL